MVGISKLERALKNVKGSYPDFVEEGLRLAKKNPENGLMILSYIEKYPDCTSSDVVYLISTQILGIKPVIPER